jgi:hypothetical protein
MSIKIDQALVDAFIAGAFSLPIAHENSSYNPTPSTAHVLLTIVRNPAQPITAGAGGMDETTGFLQATLRYPVNAGSFAAKTKADAVMLYFRIGRVFTYQGQRVQIVAKDRGTGRNEGGWYQLITRFEFNARTLRAAA